MIIIGSLILLGIGIYKLIQSDSHPDYPGGKQAWEDRYKDQL